MAQKKKWMASMDLKKGALHRALGIPEDEKIPRAKVEWAAKQPGRLGKMGRLALVFRRYK